MKNCWNCIKLSLGFIKIWFMLSTSVRDSLKISTPVHECWSATHCCPSRRTNICSGVPSGWLLLGKWTSRMAKYCLRYCRVLRGCLCSLQQCGARQRNSRMNSLFQTLVLVSLVLFLLYQIYLIGQIYFSYPTSQSLTSRHLRQEPGKSADQERHRFM